jgi:hypothetical protein
MTERVWSQLGSDKFQLAALTWEALSNSRVLQHPSIVKTSDLCCGTDR